MKITILTLFPEMFTGPFDHSIARIARENNLVEINFVNIRKYGKGKHKEVDDKEYGGGVGMLMKVDVLHEAIEKSRISNEKLKIKEKVILLSASGKTYNQQVAIGFSKLDHLILICGHYEGVDARISEYIDGEISIGDFIITGGEIPSMLITDSVVRLIKGVLPENATKDESFSSINNEVLLEYPHFTKPREYENLIVPSVLLSGNHSEIAKWRKECSIKLTQKLRPDLLKKRNS